MPYFPEQIIECRDLNESRRVQEVLFAQGFKWTYRDEEQIFRSHLNMRTTKDGDIRYNTDSYDDDDYWNDTPRTHPHELLGIVTLRQFMQGLQNA